VAAILGQLGLDSTFYIQLAIFFIFFLIISQVYFKPFLKLFEARHKKVIEDKESAEKMMNQAEAKFEEYKRRMAEEKIAARKEYEDLITEARKEESTIVGEAKEEARKITQRSAEAISLQHEQLKKKLEGDVDRLAEMLCERLT
jgi:F-type H+-transporting ATPase subunit b